MSVSLIYVPRAPVVPMDVSGVAVAGVDFIQTDKRPPILVPDVYRFHIHEKHIPAGGDPKRIIYSAKPIIDYFWDRDPLTLKRADYRMYEAKRLADGVCRASVRRELCIWQAAYNHNATEERFPGRIKIALPAGSPPRTRFLTKDEQARVMRQVMTRRTRLFFILAFGTGARAKAIEELTWDRVDFENGLINFRVPGQRLTKKRRVIAPMSDELRARLEAAWANPNRDPSDPLVIGRGCSTYYACKRVMIAAGINEAGVARHVARKSFASWRIQAGQPPKKIADLIGDTVTTFERAYGFNTPEHLREAVNAA